MSWFSRSFSMKEEEDDEEDDEEEEAERDDPLNLAAIASATGTSVKEDMSNLRKTFTRQLWGVASFLAPPPPEKSSPVEGGGGGGGGGVLGGSQEGGVRGLGTDGEVPRSSGLVEGESQSGREFTSENLGHVESDFSSVGGGASGGGLLLEESESERTATSRNAVNENALPDRPKLTGLRRDFAELRGTVATGFSRISSVIRVVAEDDDSGGDEDEEHLESSTPFSSSLGADQHVNSPRRGFDAFLKPLFGSILMRETSSDESSMKGDVYYEEDKGAEKDEDDRKSHGGGELKYRDLELLPSAIASGIDGISKFASSLLEIVTDEQDDEKEEDELKDEDHAVGLTEAVVTFARNIAKHPETWLDFPLAEDDADDDFELTDSQKEHVHALEVVAPSLEALKVELCPNYMTEGRFWKIYFVLMHSRLSSNEALMLSTQQVVRARASMLQEMQNRPPQTYEFDSSQDDLTDAKAEIDRVEAHKQDNKQTAGEIGGNMSAPYKYPSAVTEPIVASSFEDTRQAREPITADHPTSGSNEETATIQSTAEAGEGRFSMPNLEDETEVDAWLDDPSLAKQSEVDGAKRHLDLSNMSDEDVSFSDLEEDESSEKAAHTNDTITSSSPKSLGSMVLGSTATTPLVAGEGSSPHTHGDVTPRKSSEKGEFNDWWKVDQDDVASARSSRSSS